MNLYIFEVVQAHSGGAAIVGAPTQERAWELLWLGDWSADQMPRPTEAERADALARYRGALASPDEHLRGGFHLRTLSGSDYDTYRGQVESEWHDRADRDEIVTEEDDWQITLMKHLLRWGILVTLTDMPRDEGVISCEYAEE